MKQFIMLLAVMGLMSLISCSRQQASNPVVPADSLHPPGSPVITSLSPAAGQGGTTLKIVGTNFSWDKWNTVVLIGDDTAQIVSVRPPEIIVTVPMQARTSFVTIHQFEKSTRSVKPFVVLFSPSVYQTASLEISNVSIVSTDSHTSWDVYGGGGSTTSTSTNVTRNVSIDTSIGCPSQCNSTDSGTTIRLCCNQANGLLITLLREMEIDVDTVRRRFRSVGELYSRYHVGYGGSSISRSTFNLVLLDVPYEEQPDGSLICVLYSKDFDGHLNLMTSSSDYSTYVRHRGNDVVQSSSSSNTTLLPPHSPDAFIRIVIMR